MAGLAKTKEFMLGAATVMLGEQADLYTLTPDDHSIGLVKNFVLTSEPAYVELTQGVQNTIVDSTMTSNPVRATMEAYEFTARNLSYALGIEGSADLDNVVVESTVQTAVSSTPDDELILVSATNFLVGDTIAIYGAEDDMVEIRKITAKTSNTLTLAATVHDIAQGAVVKKVNALSIGSKENQPYFACKVVGVLASGERVVIYLPKVRIVRGFNLAFSTSEHGNLPIELTIYDLVSTDPNYADFRTRTAVLYRS